jgi:hypothetical protein
LAWTERTPEDEAIMAAQDLYEQWEKEHEARGGAEDVRCRAEEARAYNGLVVGAPR